MRKGDALDLVALDLLAFPGAVAEYKFHPTRKWRFDYAFPGAFIALEIDGGTWSGGRHTTGSGFAADLEKFNAAAALGWRVGRFTSGMIKAGDHMAWLAAVIGDSQPVASGWEALHPQSRPLRRGIK